MAQEHSPFSNEGWNDMNSYNQHSLTDYNNFGYLPPLTHGLPSESINRMPPPAAPVQTIPSSHSQPHTQLPMLMIPTQPAWPSMLTNPPNTYSSHSAPPLSMPPVAPAPSKPARLPNQQSQPRRTLTDDDRRRMCRYHMENPTVKQTDIGAMFGVERRFAQHFAMFLKPLADHCFSVPYLRSCVTRRSISSRRTGASRLSSAQKASSRTLIELCRPGRRRFSCRERLCLTRKFSIKPDTLPTVLVATPTATLKRSTAHGSRSLSKRTASVQAV